MEQNEHLYDAGVCDVVNSTEFAAASVPGGTLVREYLKGEYKTSKKPVFYHLKEDEFGLKSPNAIYYPHLLAREVHLQTGQEIILLNMDEIASRMYELQTQNVVFQRARHVIVHNFRTLKANRKDLPLELVNQHISALETLLTMKPIVHVAGAMHIQTADTFFRSFFLQKYHVIQGEE